MKLSPDRQNDLVNTILEELLDKEFVKASSRDVLFESLKKAFVFFTEEWEQLDEDISQKVRSIKRGVQPGSSEWEVLYNRFFEESFRKKSSLFVKK